MRKPIALVALALSAVLLVGTLPAFATGRTTETSERYSGTVDGICGFSATVAQRDPRTETTWTDRRGSMVLQTLRTKTTTEYAGGPGGAMLLDENSLVTVKPNGDGSSTILFAGRGAIWGTDTTLGQSFFEWVTGVVLMKGTFDSKAGIFLVSSKTIFGQVTPLCDSLTTGLKPRH
jgi:outer membrane lipoprotein-sorting protein